MLGLLSGQYTPQVQEAITRLGSRLSFGEAKEELELMWGIEISKGGVRAITLRHGKSANDIIEEEVKRIETEAPQPTVKPQQVVVSADGAMVLLTNGEWREVKTMAVGEFDTMWQAKTKKMITKTKNISYFSRLENADDFSRSALYEWQRRGVEQAEKVVAVNDGAVWIQSFLDYLCPQATRVIDFAHAQSYLATIGKAIHGQQTVQFQQWYAHMSHQLAHKPPQRTLSDLEFLQKQHANHPLSETLEHALAYLQRRREMIDYAHFTQAHLPIGSGMVESGQKVVVQRRFKQAGMRWAQSSLNPMLALRTTVCNKSWSDNWQAIQLHHRQAKRQQRLDHLQSTDRPQPTITISEVDCQRLEALSHRIDIIAQPRLPWQNHKWIFPHRHNFLHRL